MILLFLPILILKFIKAKDNSPFPKPTGPLFVILAIVCFVIGFLGTVIGMIQAFSTMTSSSEDKDTELAVAISGSLQSTILGTAIGGSYLAVLLILMLVRKYKKVEP